MEENVKISMSYLSERSLLRELSSLAKEEYGEVRAGRWLDLKQMTIYHTFAGSIKKSNHLPLSSFGYSSLAKEESSQKELLLEEESSYLTKIEGVLISNLH